MQRATRACRKVKIEITAQETESIIPESKNETKEEKAIKDMKKDMEYDANEMSVEELEDYLCLEESSDSDDSSIERVEENDLSDIDSEESLDSSISEASIERESNEEDAYNNSSDVNLGLKQIQYQNNLLLFRLQQSEKMKIH